MNHLTSLVVSSLLSVTVAAQVGATAWHRNGQTWIVWQDNLVFSGAENIAVYRSPAPIITLADLQNATLAGRVFPADWRAARLQHQSPGATWRIPSANGAPLTLPADRGLFVYTPHTAGIEYFAVVKAGNEATGPFTGTGPVGQTLGPIVPHLQLSGTDAGHPFRTYAYWIDGHVDPASGRPGFPIMGSASCHGCTGLFSVFDPVAAPSAVPMAGVVFLHETGASHWACRPSRSNALRVELDVPDGLLVTVDDGLQANLGTTVDHVGTSWFGTCGSFDRFVSITGPVAAGSTVVDYTHRRLRWILDWLVVNAGLDADRVSMAGVGTGGLGATTYARVDPSRIAATLAFVMPMSRVPSPFPAVLGSAAQNLPTNLPGAPGIDDVFDPTATIASGDRPFGRFVDGTEDADVAWDLKPPFYEHLEAARVGAAVYWDGRSHQPQPNPFSPGWVGQFFSGSPRFALASLTRFRAAKSFPAFHDVDHDLLVGGDQPDAGDAVVPANGDAAGTRGGWFDWDPVSIVDTPAQWSGRVWLVRNAPWPADNAPSSSAVASVTLRRLQQFAVQPGELVWVDASTTNAPSTLVFAGLVAAGGDGVVTVSSLVFGESPLQLTVTRIAASGLANYGPATPGCAGAPTIAGNVEPRLGATGFGLQFGNAPANGLGVAAFSLAPASGSLLGIQVLVDLLLPTLLVPIVANGSGNAFVPMAIPSAPGLVGMTVFVQAAWLDGCAPQGLAATGGLAIRILP